MKHCPECALAENEVEADTLVFARTPTDPVKRNRWVCEGHAMMLLEDDEDRARVYGD